MIGKASRRRLTAAMILAGLIAAIGLAALILQAQTAEAHPHWWGTTRYSLYEYSGGEYVNELSGSIAPGDWYIGGTNCSHSGSQSVCSVNVDYVRVSASVSAGNNSVHYGFHAKLEAFSGCRIGY